MREIGDIELFEGSEIDLKITRLVATVKNLDVEVKESEEKVDIITGDLVPEELMKELDEITNKNNGIHIEGYVIEEEIDAALVEKVSSLEKQLMKLMAHV